MQIVRKNQIRTLSPVHGTVIHEYDTHDGFVSGGVAEIKGRYPLAGYCVNRKIKELVYVVAGSGLLIQPSGTTEFATGDVLFIDHGELFAWEGDMELFMATTPTFDPAQHEEVAE